MANIGFIGLGIMGTPMAKNLIKNGHLTALYSRSGIPKELIKQGGAPCISPKHVAQTTDIIITMLPDTQNVERVLFDENGIVQGLSPGKIVIDMSSISPTRTRQFAAKINRLDCHYVDAPVSGGDTGAENATLTIMVGAEEEIFISVKPILKLMGKNITLIGANGSGQTCKIANQIIAALTIEAVSEALLLVSKAGVNPNKVRQALMGGFASSRILETHGKRMINKSFEPGFRVELHQKDLSIALSYAHELGINLPNTKATLELLNACITQGDAKLDSSVMIKTLEKLISLNTQEN
ncbi:MAG: 2-hydroxy-3-oxopropionate reductase [Nitrosomonadaceae bacterium]|nr:2-hydroxy-3-oxopropionate reductase [Nitrosomonadaceae bacterium]|tara:strand:- start:78 stop:965 length:888 start_codon:yes stop_codon:yes gene_type:complete